MASIRHRSLWHRNGRGLFWNSLAGALTLALLLVALALLAAVLFAAFDGLTLILAPGMF